MEKHEEFAEWAEAQGVKINGIAAHRFPGAGVGIVATTKLKVGSLFSMFLSHEKIIAFTAERVSFPPSL